MSIIIFWGPLARNLKNTRHTSINTCYLFYIHTYIHICIIIYVYKYSHILVPLDNVCALLDTRVIHIWIRIIISYEYIHLYTYTYYHMCIHIIIFSVPLDNSNALLDTQIIHIIYTYYHVFWIHAYIDLYYHICTQLHYLISCPSRHFLRGCMHRCRLTV